MRTNSTYRSTSGMPCTTGAPAWCLSASGQPTGPNPAAAVLLRESAFRLVSADHGAEVQAGGRWWRIAIAELPGQRVGCAVDITPNIESKASLERINERLENRLEERTTALSSLNERVLNEQRDRRVAEHKAGEAHRVKSSFLANMSHELRTPLNAILGYTELLSEDLTGEQLEDLNKVKASAGHLLQIVGDVLDLSRLEAGTMEVERSEVSVADLIARVTTSARKLAAQRGNELRVSVEPLEDLWTDANKLRRIVSSLVDNAVKFTHDGAIDIEAGRSAFGVRIAVRDTGIGIEQSRLHTLFDAFVQADTTTTRAHDGLGLGLAISKRYANMLGGSLSVSSTQGEGSEFVLYLPNK